MRKGEITKAEISRWLGTDADMLQAISGIRTPAYVYSYNNFLRRSDLLKRNLSNISPSVNIFYSMKANPSRTVMDWTINSGYFTEVSSLGELKHAIRMGQTPKKMLFLGPGKSSEAMKYVLDLGIFAIAAESFRELDFIAGNHNGKTIVFIRVNIENSVPGVKESMVGNESKFGIDISELPSAFRKLSNIKSKMKGIHYYMGSQLSDYSLMLSFHRDILSSISRYSAEFSNIDVGGGFGIPYSNDQKELDMEKFSAGLKSLLEEFSLSNNSLFFESGRYLTAEAGILVTRVMDVKEYSGKKVIVTDGGMNSFMRIAFMKDPHPVERIFPESPGVPVTKGIVFGPLCTPLDCFGTDVNLPDNISVGDLIGIFKTGAYGITLSPVFFQLHSIPSEYSIRDGTISEVTKKKISAEELFNLIY